MKLLLIILLFLIACEEEKTPCWSISDSLRVEQRVWVLNCIEKANPKSNEEPEDWIEECEDVSIRLYGDLIGPKNSDWGKRNYLYLCL